LWAQNASGTRFPQAPPQRDNESASPWLLDIRRRTVVSIAWPLLCTGSPLRIMLTNCTIFSKYFS
jgi:hypothetical protein